MDKQMETTSELWKDFQVIHSYTRAQALEDGSWWT